MKRPAGEQNRTPDATRIPGGFLVVPIVREPAAPPPRSDRLVRGAACVLAVAAHAAVLYSLFREPNDPTRGAGGQSLGAVVSVAMISSSVLESRDADQLQTKAPAAVAPVEANDGAQDQPTPATTDRPDQPEEKEERVERQKPPEETLQTDNAVVDVAPKSAHARKAEESAQPHGGAAARGEADAATDVGGQAAASPGAAREYERKLSAALAKAKPVGVGIAGAVKIKFALSPQGRLVSAEVLVSSGSIRLDEMALEAVRRAVLPPPPPGMTVAQLTYDVTYGFR